MPCNTIPALKDGERRNIVYMAVCCAQRMLQPILFTFVYSDHSTSCLSLCSHPGCLVLPQVMSRVLLHVNPDDSNTCLYSGNRAAQEGGTEQSDVKCGQRTEDLLCQQGRSALKLQCAGCCAAPYRPGARAKSASDQARSAFGQEQGQVHMLTTCSLLL